MASVSVTLLHSMFKPQVDVCCAVMLSLTAHSVMNFDALNATNTGI